VKPMNWKSFLAGLVCGCLGIGGALYFFFRYPASQTPTSHPMTSVRADSRLATTISSTPPHSVTGPDPAEPPEVQLRPANFPCEHETIEKAVELKRAGWTYIMPKPRDAQARWGNGDSRTTWWVGYWTNERNHTTSALQPQRDATGYWIGDGKGIRYWRRGGSPLAPTKIEWLCSTSGGFTPQ
jgi:hypothetical protein